MKFFLPVFFVCTLALPGYGQDFRFAGLAGVGPDVTQAVELPQIRNERERTRSRVVSLRRSERRETLHYARLNCGVPNPYRPGTPIGCSELPPGAYTLELYDSWGRRVLSQTLSVDLPTVFPEDLSPGTYLVKIRTGDRPLLCERIVVLPDLR